VDGLAGEPLWNPFAGRILLELRSESLRLGLCEQDAVGQVSDVLGADFGSGQLDHQVETATLERGVGIRVLHEEPSRVRPVAADERRRRPSEVALDQPFACLLVGLHHCEQLVSQSGYRTGCQNRN
jgi:hypothetical protein